MKASQNSKGLGTSPFAVEVLKLKDEFAEFHAMNAFVQRAMGLMLTSDAMADPAIADGAQICSELVHAMAQEIKEKIDNLHTVVKTKSR